MLTMHPTLLIGPADWDPERMPQAEFAARIARLWLRWPDARGAIVYGDSRDHAALAYLTNFTPKLEPAIALIPRDGDARLMVGGGANMISAAKPLTWVANLVPLRPTGKTIAQWCATIGGLPVCVGIDAMLTRMRRDLDAAFDGQTPHDGIAEVQAIMQVKSARELSCLREASAALKGAVDAMADAHRSQKGVTDVILAGEHAAIKLAAQDVRTLYSLDGGRSYRPFEVPVEHAADPLTVYIAVCRFGYWVDGYVTLADGAATFRPAA
jgi:Xaa-Pro aminopeptidase